MFQNFWEMVQFFSVFSVPHQHRNHFGTWFGFFFCKKNSVFCGKPCCFQSSQWMLQTSPCVWGQVTKYQIYIHWYVASNLALGSILMHVVRNAFKIWILSGTPLILSRGHPDIWGRMNMDKMLNIREEQSQGGTKLAADISTAHSSMLEIPRPKKVLIKNRLHFILRRNLYYQKCL